MVALQCNLILFMVFTLSSALYNSNSDVIELTETNFNSKVLDSESIWIVEFYAPWCGHCQGLVPEYSKAATGLKGIVKVGGVDADVHKSLAAKYGIRGFPTIKVFGTDKNKPEDYQGPRTASGFVDAAFKVLRKKADAQLGGGKKPESSGGKQGDESDVIELTDNNFEKLVLNSEDMWLVEFYAPWCGHCKNLAPHWASAATELKGKVKLGAVDATVHTVITSRHQVHGYPTIKYFPGGKKDGTVEDYSGGRTSGEIVQWALEKLAENISPPEVVEIISDDVLKGNCEDHQLCIISVLPHILDCQSDCRNAYLTVLRKLGEKFKKNMWGWLWVEAGAQTDLEASFEIGGFGYPAMAALNTRKMKCSILKGSFSFEGINDFLRELAYGRGSTFPVKGSALPKISSATPWDGKDGHLDIVEDYDLSDVELDDLDSAKDEL